MNAKEASTALEWVLRRKVIAIVRGLEPEHMVKLACALYEGGVDLIEVTFNQAKPETWKDTAAAIQAVCRELAGKVLPGAGTVMTEEQLLSDRVCGQLIKLSARPSRILCKPPNCDRIETAWRLH